MRDNCCQHEITMLAEDRVNTSVPSSVYTSINNPEDTTSEVNIYIYRYFILYVNTILYISISDTVLRSFATKIAFISNTKLLRLMLCCQTSIAIVCKVLNDVTMNCLKTRQFAGHLKPLLLNLNNIY